MKHGDAKSLTHSARRISRPARSSGMDAALLGRFQRPCGHRFIPDRPWRQSRRAERGRGVALVLGRLQGAHSSCPASPDRRCEAEPNRCGRTRRALARKKFGPTGHRCHLGGASRPAPKPCPAWDFGRGHLIRPLHPCSPAARGREQRTSRQDPGNRPGTDRIPGAVVPKISFLPQNVANRRDNPRLSRVVICIFIRVRSLTIVCTGVPCNTVRKNQGCRHGQKRDLQVRGGAGT